MKIAYLVNQYPKVSHTFIRREIAALEAEGLRVERFSIRRVVEALADPKDAAERDRTRVLLEAGASGLALALVRTALGRPADFWRGLALAIRVGIGSERGVLVHLVYLAEACLLAEWLRASGALHLHAHFGTNSTTVAMLCSAIGGPGFSFTAHGPEEFDKPDLIRLREKIRRARFVAAVSSFGRSQLMRHCPSLDWGKLVVVRCGVDASYLEAVEAPTADATSVAPRLVCVGRLCEQKGQLLLVEAAALLAKGGLAFEIVLVGDGEMRAEVQRAIDAAALGDRIRITGWAAGPRVRIELTRARALVLPSFAEGLPVVIMEAFALRRPVISTYVAGIPELVETGRCGWLVPAGSVESLAEAMREALLAPPDTLRRLGDEGRRRVERLHDAAREARELLAHFRATVQGDRR